MLTICDISANLGEKKASVCLPKVCADNVILCVQIRIEKKNPRSSILLRLFNGFVGKGQFMSALLSLFL